jgi:hypothetical protein
MRRTIQIRNETNWRTNHLRAFVVRAARQAFDDDQNLWIRVTFRRVKTTATRAGGGVSGHAAIGGAWCVIDLSNAAPDREDLAHVLHHEFGHMRGLRHDDMRGAPLWRRIGNWREHFAWALELPLEQKPAACKPPKPTRAQRIEHEQRKLARWQSKRKRAETSIRSISRKIKRLQWEERRATMESPQEKA